LRENNSVACEQNRARTQYDRRSAGRRDAEAVIAVDVPTEQADLFRYGEGTILKRPLDPPLVEIIGRIVNDPGQSPNSLLEFSRSVSRSVKAGSRRHADCVPGTTCDEMLDCRRIDVLERQDGAEQMDDLAYGQLTNPQAWQDVLPSDVFDGLCAWIRGQPFDLTHRRWLNGQSGSFIAAVRQRPPQGMLQGAIVKLLPPDLGPRETRGVHLAEQCSPPEFVKAHLVPMLWTGALPSSGWWLHIQKVAQADVATMLQLARLMDDAEFATYCATVLAAIAAWSDGRNDPAPSRAAPGAFLRADLSEKKLEGLKSFAHAAALDLERPTPEMRVPGRPEPLPNPLALLAGTIGSTDTVEVFLGNGHGDLHPGNILVPVDASGVKADEFRIIDLGRFSIQMPVSRDPAKLLLWIAAAWIRSLVPESAIRSTLAELIVSPDKHPSAPPIAGYLNVARAIRTAGASWATRRSLFDQSWELQHVLVLAATALRTVARDDLSLADRWWYFEVAALAIRRFLSDDDGDAPPTTPPTPSIGPRPVSPSSSPAVTRDAAPSAPNPDHPRSYSGWVKVQVCRRLGSSWPEVADLLEIPRHESARFHHGDESRGIWEWLAVRGRLGDLPGALRTVDRFDLVELLERGG